MVCWAVALGVAWRGVVWCQAQATEARQAHQGRRIDGRQDAYERDWDTRAQQQQQACVFQLACLPGWLRCAAFLMCSAVQCSAVQCSAVQCSAVHMRALAVLTTSD